MGYVDQAALYIILTGWLASLCVRTCPKAFLPYERDNLSVNSDEIFAFYRLISCLIPCVLMLFRVTIVELIFFSF